MSAFALLSLLAVTLFIPALTNDDDEDTETTVEPEAPVEPEVIEGTADADLLTALSGQEINGLDGDDTLSTAGDSDGSIINGDAGNDSLELGGTNATARGGAGDDTIISTNILNGVAEGGDGNDDITFTPLRPGDALDGSEVVDDTSRVDGGAGNDTITAGGYGGDVFGGEGDDEIYAQGSLDGVDGGAGNDQIFYDSSVFDGGGTPVLGGEGNDTISHSSFDNNTGGLRGANIDAGAGEDTIEDDIYIGADADTVVDTLTGGLGADSFVISFYNTETAGGDRDAGLVATITDFDTDEDVVLLIPDVQRATNEGDNAGVIGQITGFELVEADDGSFTDVIFEATSDAPDGSTVSGTIRLLGTAGVTDTNILISRPTVAVTEQTLAGS